MLESGDFFVRVISGTARGRKLREPAGDSIRPTGDMVKESVFNIIQFDIEGRRVLDLFAGTGQLGIEALSRGAKSAVFIDFKPDAVKLIRENLKICGFSELASVGLRDALRFLEGTEKFESKLTNPESAPFRHQGMLEPGIKGSALVPDKGKADRKYDLIILDPPYNTPLIDKAISKIIEFDKLNLNGIIICETKADTMIPDVFSSYFSYKEYRYGTVKIVRLSRRN
jgi:16S rRNA G966 N2-methylase RsmD